MPVLQARRILASSTLLLGLISFHAGVFAQESSSLPQTATLSVIVSDPSGAVISNAEVRFKGEKEVIGRTMKNGSVQFSLPYGSYVVWFTSPGFKTTKIVRFTVNVPTPDDLNMVLQPAPCCEDSGGEPGSPPLIQPITSQLPDVIEPNLSAPLWSWFGNCGEEASMGLEVRLDSKLIQRLSFPICPIMERSNETDSSKRTVNFSFKGGRVFQGEYHTTRNETIEGGIWQAGTEPGIILLGISFSTKKQILLNTIHIAKVDSVSTSEVDRGLTVRTFPITKPKSSINE